MAEGQDENPGSAPPRDDVLRKRDFRRPRGMDLGSFMVNSNEPAEGPVEVDPKPAEEVDEAIGEMVSIFSSGDESRLEPGAVQRDGTVRTTPEMDSVEDLAVHGERRLGLGLLIAMVTVWSAIGAVVGTVLPPVLSGIGSVSYTHLTLPTNREV